MPRSRKKSLVLGTTLILILLVFLEATLRLSEKLLGLQMNGLETAFCQEVYFSSVKATDPISPGPEYFDEVLGWRNGKSRTLENGKSVELRQGFRIPENLRQRGRKKRVVLVGDSFTFGSHLANNETASAHLQQLLGPDYEVFNLGVEGFSFHQIGAAALIEAAKLMPDYLIFAFIADDLARSCNSCYGGTLRPYYQFNGTSLEFINVPLPVPGDEREREKTEKFPGYIAISARLARIRLLRLVSEPYYILKKQNCLSAGNYQVAKAVSDKFGRERMLFVNLYGQLPSRFRELMKAVNFVDLDPEIPRLEKRWNLKAGKTDLYHPDSTGARLHASYYQEWIHSVE